MGNGVRQEGNAGSRAALASAAATLACLLCAASATAATPLNEPPQPGRAGRTLTSATGSWLCLGSCTYSYAWERCQATCEPVPGAAGAGYVLRTADIGSTIRSVVTATDGLGPGTRPSAQTAPIASAPPVNLSLPTAGGTPRVGSTLVASPGTWADPSPGNVIYSRAWLRCTTLATSSCAPVSTASSYVPGAADVGRFIRRLEIAEGLGGAAAFSLALGAIQPAAAGGPFSSGGGSTGRPSAGAKRLRPFPVVVIAGRLRGGRTVISEFLVRGPRRARVRLSCRGTGCPFTRIAQTIGARKRVRIRRAERRYRAGNVVEIRVTGTNRIGKFTRLRFRTGAAPRRRDMCLQPGARAPSRCP